MDFLAHFCLKFGHITFILPVVMIGMIFHKRSIYAKAACFLLWVMIFNTLLKQLFKVPLFPHLGPGYAFPSGHMHATAVFYGYFIYCIANKYVRAALLALIACIGFSLVYCHFHDWIDVSGAIVFSIAEIFLYHTISKNFGERVVGTVAIVSAATIMLVLNAIYKVESHVWLAFYGLIGTEFALNMEEKTFKNKSQKFAALLLSIAAIAAVYFLFKYLSFNKHSLSEIKFALISPIIVGFSNLSTRIKTP